MLYKIWEKNSGDYHQNNTVTITSILSCNRKVFLERRVPYHESPDKLWYSIRGTALHEVLDPHGKLKDWVSEKRFHRSLTDPDSECPDCKGTGYVKHAHMKHEEPCGCCHIGGQIDGLDLKTMTVYDKKSIGDNGLAFIKGGAKDKHILQVNIYRWVMKDGIIHDKELSKPEKTNFEKRGYIVSDPVAESHGHIRVSVPVENLKIQYMSMMQVVETGGLLRDKTRLLVSPPEKNVTEVSRRVLSTSSDRRTGAQTSSYELVYRVPEIPVMEDDIIRDFVLEQRKALIEGFKTGTPPGMAGDDERRWLCGFCPVKAYCDKINENTDKIFVFPMEG